MGSSQNIGSQLIPFYINTKIEKAPRKSQPAFKIILLLQTTTCKMWGWLPGLNFTLSETNAI